MISEPSEVGAAREGSRLEVEELVRVNVIVPARVRKEWKAVALATDKTLTDFIVEAMQHHINRTKQTEISTL